MNKMSHKHLFGLIVLVIFLAQAVNAAGSTAVNNTTVEGQPQGGFQGSSGWNSNSTPTTTTSTGGSTIFGVDLLTFVMVAILVVILVVGLYYFFVMKK